MIIRQAVFPDDADTVLPFAWLFAIEAGIADLLDDNWADDVLAVMTAPGAEVWLAVDEGKVVGGLGLITHPFLWNPRIKVRTELFMWVLSDANAASFLRLFRHALSLPTDAKIDEWSMLPGSPAGLAKVYVKAGFRPVQATYWRAI